MNRLFILIFINVIFPKEFTNYVSSNRVLNQNNYNDDSKLEPPSIMISASSSVKVKDDFYRLSCKASGEPAPTVKWFYESKTGFSEVTESDKFLFHQTENIDITLPNSNSRELLYCQATNIMGSVLSTKILIQKLYLSKDLKIQYDSLEVRENEKAVITCEINPDIFAKDYDLKYWEVRSKKKNDKLIQIYKTDNRFSVITVVKPFQLHIRNVTREDFNDMEVRCVVGNRFLPDDIFEMNVWTKPKQFPYSYDNGKVLSSEKCHGKDILVMKGSTVELPWCSKPETQNIMWYRSVSSSLMHREKINVIGTKFKMVDKRYGNLLINGVDFSDQAYYFVMYKSELLRDYTAFYIRVKENLRINIEPNYVKAEYNQSVVLICTVSGYPVTSINWYHNAIILGPGNQTDINTALRKTSWSFKATTKTFGVYQCVAEYLDPSDNNRLSENVQFSTPVVIGVMAPRLVSQIPSVNPGEQYSTSLLETETSVIRIQCSFESVPKATIEWFLDDESIPIVDPLIPGSSWIKPFTLTSSLEIDFKKLASIGDKWKYGGKYRAVATNKHGTAECTTLVFVSGVFRIRDPKDVKYFQGQKLSLKCYVISESRPEISWSRIKNGKVIRLPENHIQEVSSDHREFTIKKLDKVLHEGVYTCNSNLKNRDISHNFTITIAKPPLVLVQLPEKIFLGKSSDSSSQSCLPRQKPDKPWYAWWEFHPYKSPNPPIVLENHKYHVEGIQIDYQTDSMRNDDPYSPTPEGIPRFLKFQPNQPVLLKVQVNDKLHLSNVTCVVRNNYGIIRKTIEIIIINITFENTFPTEMNVILGDSLVLNCSAKSNELQTVIIWQFEENLQPETFVDVSTSPSSRIHQSQNGKLVVNNISLSDPKRFMCIIKSDVGSHKASKVLKIDIKVPAEIIEWNDTIDLQRYTNQQVACIVQGDKKDLQVFWQRKNMVSWEPKVNKSGLYPEGFKDSLTKVVMEFYNVNQIDEGQYKCIAKNEYNRKSVEKYVQIYVVSVPDSVEIKKETIISKETSIFLSWNDPENDGKKPILKYLVSYSTDKHSWNKTTEDQKITLTNLQPYKRYNISIHAINKVGLGRKSEVFVNTLEAAPSEPVLGLSATANSSTSITLTWNPPDPSKINGKFKHYQYCFIERPPNSSNVESLSWPPNNKTVEKRLDPSDRNRIVSECRITDSTFASITDLLKFREYAFKVILVNGGGSSPPAYATNRTLEDYPERAPTSVHCNSKEREIELMWEPPPINSTNGVIKDYYISYFRYDHLKEPDRSKLSIPLKYILRELQPNTNYTIKIRVENKIGSGPPSEPIHCRTNEAAPGAPTLLKAFFIDPSCALVVWSPPVDPNGYLKNFVINIADKIPLYVPVTSIQPYYKHKVCDLDSRSYQISVYAENSKIGASINTTIEQQLKSRIISPPATLSVPRNSYLVLDCETVPKNIVLWLLNHSNLPKPILENGSLPIGPFTEEDQGIYRCKVQNEDVYIEYNVSLKKISRGVPKQPIVDFFNSSTASIFVSWQSAGSSDEDDPITSFFIKLKAHNESFMREHEIPGSQRSFKILGLDCGTKFNMKIFARNAVGNSSQYNIEVQTKGTKPILADTSKIVLNKYSHSVCMNFKAFPDGQGCPALKFEVEITPSSSAASGNGATIETIMRKDLLHDCYNISNLHPNTDYRYTIKASNKMGSVEINGHFKTEVWTQNIVTTTKIHTTDKSHLTIAIILFCVVIILFIIVGASVYILRVQRQRRDNNLNPTHPISNPIKAPLISHPQPTPASIHRNRKLPTPPDPNNIYDKGISQLKQSLDENDDDEMLKPYATYEPTPKQNPLTIQDRSIGRHMVPYNMGSQAHSYQYPDMLDNPQHLPPPDTSSGMKYQNDVKQPHISHPLKGQQRPYDKGYSRGSESLSTLRPQNVRPDHHQNLEAAKRGNALPMISVSESEPYRTSSSLCSSTTESSTKEELSQVFRHNTFGGNLQFSNRLQEQDEDGTSTARGNNRSTLMNSSRHINNTDDSIHPDSYCESGSSGDDCGIRNFTQDPPGQPSITIPTIIRQSNFPRATGASFSYDSTNRHQLVPSSFAFQQHSRNPLSEEVEEEDSKDYTNQFVLV